MFSKKYQYIWNMKTTQDIITELNPNEIFVFGSNLDGFHAGGAAFTAFKKFGAKMGQAVGLQGQSYAIPTLSHAGGTREHMLSVNEIGNYVSEFLNFAAANPQYEFLVTPIGCGIAGFTPQQIAPLFAEAYNLENVHLPESFINELDSQNSLKESIIENVTKMLLEKRKP